MKIFLIGDYYSGTGPANVTAKYIENIPGVIYLKTRNKLLRAAELFVKIIKSDVLLLSGHSKQNILSLKLAHLFKKKGAYLMHGCVEYENEINHAVNENMTKTERLTMEMSDAIYAVSGQFGEWLKEHYPEYKDKIFTAENGIDEPSSSSSNEKRKPYQLISIGGGMPRKMIKYIAQAVTLIREEENFYDVRLVVIGDNGFDNDEINRYSCVSNLGLVDHDTCLRLLDQSALFVQNSCFETFGLAPLEALLHGCAVLMSKHVGAIELFNGLRSQDLIEDYSDATEIAGKIKGLLTESNNERLRNALDISAYSWEKRALAMTDLLGRLLH